MDTGTASPSAASLQAQLHRALIDLERAAGSFRALRREALTGTYDPDAYDRAVLAVREAAARVRAALGAGAEAVPGATPRRGGPDRAPSPLARLRFARWLVETGRLSEQITDPAAGGDGHLAGAGPG